MSSAASDVVIYHNPACGTSRRVLAELQEQGLEPRVVDYLKDGWTRETLEKLFARMGVLPSEVLRVRGGPAEALGLTADGAGQEAILTAMTEHPILVERPIVETAKGAVLCRPAERLAEVL